GKPFYRLTPAELAQYHMDFVTRCGVQIVGGCCGTTPEHLKAVADTVRSLTPGTRHLESLPSVASLYQSVNLTQEPAPCMVGERTNANGSKAFRDLLLNNDWDGMTAMGREQGQGGAHLLDLSVAFVGRQEAQDMQKLVPLFAQQVKLPLVIDSTEPPVIAAALERHPGRCIINSVNFEDGGKRLREVAAVAREFGSALICLTIDEEGMAKTADRKLAIAHRLFDTLTGEFGFRPHDLVFDPLTFTVGSGEASLRDAAVQTLEAIRRIKTELPGCFTILGVSNVSFGLAPEAREVLNSVFLHEAVQAGLSLAIVNPRGIIPHFKIPEEIRHLALALLTQPDPAGASLAAFMAAFSGGIRKPEQATATTTPAERLRLKILDGDRSGLEAILDQLRSTIAPIDIINLHLIPAMKEVGELFGRGEMQLPFVLQSAEVMKTAVTLLERHMEKRPPDPRKKIVLATVRGDVHDIGKNLVDILLSNNGFAVTNLGIKVDIDTMIKAAQEEQAPVIGMSGLLVKSTVIMKENLEELNRRQFTPTVLLGGAALTRSYVEETLQSMYHGRVLYARDAMDGLAIMQKLSESEPDSLTTRTIA
ncbi:MAG TPA: dihydropteroate synthase, partial [Candidatus Ozemobacteraceae bacterium]|nr:dihydropteroate synthase [Candidatus Ozemobacteraceae bacterium]